MAGALCADAMGRRILRSNLEFTTYTGQFDDISEAALKPPPGKRRK